MEKVIKKYDETLKGSLKKYKLNEIFKAKDDEKFPKNDLRAVSFLKYITDKKWLFSQKLYA